MSLEREVQQYKLHLSALLGEGDVNEGRFTVIKGDDIQGPFDTYKAALKAGYDKYGPVSFLVQKIERNETAMYFSRDVS
jgi:hypothetical protein